MRKRDKQHACKDPWYKGLKHVVQKKLRSAYYQYVEDIINPCDNDNPLEANKHFFSLLNHAKSDNTGVHPLKNNRTLISDPKGKALLLNTYFQSVFTRESPLSRKKHGQKTILDNTQEDSFQYPTMPETIITCDGIIRLLKNLKSRKAAGPDDLMPAVLKELSTEIAPVLQKIYSNSIQTHIISTENYRPISLTCICSKILGHIITSCRVVTNKGWGPGISPGYSEHGPRLLSSSN